MEAKRDSFWKRKPLADMTKDEWESLCDRCGRCCLHKIDDEVTGRIYHTAVACRLLDIETCRCRHYKNRRRHISHCLSLKPGEPETFRLLPESCAYRLLAEGKDLEWWHPLVSGKKDTVHQAGISVRAVAISESFVHPEELRDYLSTLILESVPFEDKIL